MVAETMPPTSERPLIGKNILIKIKLSLEFAKNLNYNVQYKSKKIIWNLIS